MKHWNERVFKDKSHLFADSLRHVDSMAEDEVENILDLIQTEFNCEPEMVLDAGCGLGRHALEFGERGYRTDGIDFSPDYIDDARRRARERGIDDRVTFHTHDMRELDDWEGSYDLVVNLFGAFGFYGRKTDQKILADFYARLSDDGVLVMEIANKANEIHTYEPYTVEEASEGLVVQRDRYDVEEDVLHSTYELFDGEDDRFEYRGQMAFKYHLYSIPEITYMCERAGFDDVTIIPKESDDLGLDTEILIVLAT